MQEKIRILLADDSAVVRQMLKETLSAEPDLKVVQALTNGRQVVKRLQNQDVDVVVLDIEMPDVNGIQATEEIRKFDKDIPIIIFSSLSTAGGQATLQALMAGASDCVAKPTATGRLQDAIRHIQTELVPMIRSLSRVGVKTNNQPVETVATQPTRDFESTVLATAFDVVTIGVSTGGPNALSRLLQKMPTSFPVPILIVHHMPSKFTQLLAQRLDGECPLTVVEADDGQLAMANHVYIAPGGRHLRVSGHPPALQLVLDDGLPVNSCRPSVDVLFRSAAMACGNSVLGVILTGMGCDGVAGARDIKAGGGGMIAQDEATSTVWGMPGEAVKQGLADQVLPLDQIAGELVRRVPSGRPAMSHSMSASLS